MTGIVALRQRGRANILLDASWARDLAHHTYLAERIVVLCPIAEVDEAPSGYQPFDDPRFTFEPLPLPSSTLRYVLTGQLVRTVHRLWRAMDSADIMFGGLVEHPVPLGWFAFPTAKLRRVVAYTWLESAPWRLVPYVKATWKARVRSAVTTTVNRLVLRLIDFAAITQPAYGEMLPPRCPRILTPASWFLLEEMSPEPTHAEIAATAHPHCPVVLFAGRLDAAKGVRQLLEAAERLDADGKGPIRLRVLGGGPLAGEVASCRARLQVTVLEQLAPVPYGPEFFAVLRSADCVVVPSLSDEQPRIVFDAASQGVAIIGSDTTGIRSVVVDGTTGTLVPPGDSEALATALGHLRDAENLRRTHEMGREAWAAAREYDHTAMHRRRLAFLRDRYGTSS